MLITEKNNYSEIPELALRKLSGSDWEIKFPLDSLEVGESYGLKVYYDDTIQIEAPNLSLVKSYNKNLKAELAVAAEISSYAPSSDHFYCVNTSSHQKIIELDAEEINNSESCLDNLVKKLKAQRVNAISFSNIFFEGSCFTSLSLNINLVSSDRWSLLVEKLHQNNILVFGQINHLKKMPKNQVIKILQSNTESQFFLSTLNYFVDRMMLSGLS